MSEWINVKDRLPEYEGLKMRYLVFEKKQPHAHNAAAYDWPHPSCCNVNIAYYHRFEHRWKWDSFSEKECNPTHWMSLPEIPND